MDPSASHTSPAAVPDEPDVALVAAPTLAPPSERRGPTNGQYLLGLFVLWQLFFVFAANFIALARDVQNNASYIPKDWEDDIQRSVPWLLDKKSHFSDVLTAIEGNTERWSYLTFQPQAWKLFAPNVGKDSTFIAVEMRWDDDEGVGKTDERTIPYAPELLLSDNEPADPLHFFRLGLFRMRKYEGNLDVSLSADYSDDPQEIARDWAHSIEKRLIERWDNIHAYFLYRWREFEKKHPDRPMPRQFILHVRRFAIPPPERYSHSWYWPDSVPMVRWKPGRPGESPYFQMARYVPGAYDVLCSDMPGLRSDVPPEILALAVYLPGAAPSRSLVLAGAYHRVFAPGRFVGLD